MDDWWWSREVDAMVTLEVQEWKKNTGLLKHFKIKIFIQKKTKNFQLECFEVFLILCLSCGHTRLFVCMFVCWLFERMNPFENVSSHCLLKNALTSSIPYLVCWILLLVASVLGDYLVKSRVLRVITVRKLFTSLSKSAITIKCVSFSNVYYLNKQYYTKTCCYPCCLC